MAAILCTTIGDLLSRCCRSLSKPCDCLCRGCGKACQEVGELFCTPFAPYLICTLALNTPAIVYAIKSVDEFGCSFSLAKWLTVNAAFAAAHIVASFYIATIIQAPGQQALASLVVDPTPVITAKTGLNSAEATEEGRNNAATANAVDAIRTNFQAIGDDAPGGANSYKRITHVLCYDKGMAIYIVIFLAWVVWMGLGVSRRLFSDDYADDCGDMTSYMSTAIACGYVYMSLVSVAFCCSLLCLR